MWGSLEIQAPTALWVAALCVLPALIFFFFRPRPREMSWGAMRFLVQAQKKMRRKTRLREWLTLFLQSIAILGIALAASRPVFWRNGLASEDVRANVGGAMATERSQDAVGTAVAERSQVSRSVGRFRLILFDNSASMGAEFEKQDGSGWRGSRFEEARRAALRQIGRWRRSGTERILVLPTNPAESDRDVFSSKPELGLGRIFPENEVADWIGTLERVERLDGECAEICVFSDFVRNEAVEILQKLRRSRPEAKCYATPVDMVSRNLSVSGLEMKETPVVVGQKQGVRVTLRNESGVSSPSVCVNLTQRRKETGEGSFRFVKKEQKWSRIPANEELDVEFEVDFSEIGEYLLSAELEIIGDGRNQATDGFSLDNVRNLVVHAKEKGVFLIAEGWNSEFESEKTSATPYLRAALEGIFSGRFPDASSPVLKVDCRKDVDLVGLDLTQYDALFLCGISFFTPEESEALAEYARSGGGVCVFPGEKTREGTLDGLESVLPGTFSGSVSAPDDFLRVVLPKEKSVITEIFKKNPDSGLDQVPILRWIPVKMDSAGKRVLEASNGTTLLATRELEDGGRTVVWGVPADSTGSALPLLPVWAPLVERTLHFLTSSAKRLPEGEENCPDEESRFLNRTLAPGEFPEGWEILLPEKLEAWATEETEASPWISALFLISAIAVGGAGLCVWRDA